MYLETLNPGGIIPKPPQILTLWFPVTPGHIIKSSSFQIQKAFADLINVEHPIYRLRSIDSTMFCGSRQLPKALLRML